MIDLVIFDADGVLVDSEEIALAVLAQAARQAGAQIELPEALALFRGLKIADCVTQIENRSGRPVGDGFIDDVRHATALAFEADLRAVEGVHEALAAISIPVCVASNGPMSKLSQTLSLTGLQGRFEGRVFSAYEVGSWKPDPGLFLHAARTLGADPSRCVVIEDSVTGVSAAKAAEMRVLGFTGGRADAGLELSQAGAQPFDRMAELPALLASLSPSA
ncbi:HAD family hydrolase [Phenylobacterium sp.]|uniref:HAD family hydrolase n=1 Tax=Phenylobacterium sp. TaxID=1871053 RepID=UPI00272FF593|nr:HAD family hydrolase [Phenylobacterium sp.]MDP1597750.1 HAD family hydrolase [Phenylobacterium sp.]MDP3590237.1 HAD family hydrolase [Phenylobacterium sp.]